MKKIPYKSFTFNGEKYRAVPSNNCDGCAFLYNIRECMKHPSKCSDANRPDKTSVIWIKVMRKHP